MGCSLTYYTEVYILIDKKRGAVISVGKLSSKLLRDVWELFAA